MALRESEHGHDVPADRVAAHRPESVQPGQEPVDVGHRDLVDVAAHALIESLEVESAGPDVDLAHPADPA